VRRDEEDGEEAEVDWDGYEKEDSELDPQTGVDAESSWSEDGGPALPTVLMNKLRTDDRRKPVDPGVIVRCLVLEAH
jgi:hypothetical protein